MRRTAKAPQASPSPLAGVGGLLLCLLLSFCLSANAKEKKKDEPTPLKTLIKDARKAVKDGSNQSGAEKKLLEALKRPELTDRDRAAIYFTAAQLQESVNAGENLKAYIKQKYDTAQFFSSILSLYGYVLRADSLDTLPDQRDRRRPLYQQKGRELLLRHRKNLLSGGKWNALGGRNKEAYPFFEMYLRTMNEPRLQFAEPDSSRYRVEYLATYSAYRAKRYAEAALHIDSAIVGARSDRERMSLMEVRSLTFASLADTARYITSLREGNAAYPADNYFFLRLMDHIQAGRNYDEGLRLANTQLQRVGPRMEYYFAKSLMFLRLEEADSCIAMSDSVLVYDHDHQEALYNKGVSYIQKAVAFAETACTDLRLAKCRKDREQIIQYYRSALEPMERFRALAPDAIDRWGRPLYRIYLYLNMGKEFDEIEKLLK